MQKSSALFRTLAWVVLLSCLSALLPMPALAEPLTLTEGPVQTSGAALDMVDLSYMPAPASPYAGEKQDVIVVAALDKTDQSAVGSPTQSANRDCCGGFWEIHFGGYRWAWWALAGAGLIAIHAN